MANRFFGVLCFSLLTSCLHPFAFADDTDEFVPEPVSSGQTNTVKVVLWSISSEYSFETRGFFFGDGRTLVIARDRVITPMKSAADFSVLILPEGDGQPQNIEGPTLLTLEHPLQRFFGTQNIVTDKIPRPDLIILPTAFQGVSGLGLAKTPTDTGFVLPFPRRNIDRSSRQDGYETHVRRVSLQGSTGFSRLALDSIPSPNDSHRNALTLRESDPFHPNNAFRLFQHFGPVEQNSPVVDSNGNLLGVVSYSIEDPNPTTGNPDHASIVLCGRVLKTMVDEALSKLSQ